MRPNPMFALPKAMFKRSSFSISWHNSQVLNCVKHLNAPGLSKRYNIFPSSDTNAKIYTRT
jgi:hypothetical protein